MTVYVGVTARLAMLGYTVTNNDTAGINHTIGKCEKLLCTDLNTEAVPDELFDVLVDMVTGYFLYDKKAIGGLADFDFSAPAKSITEGDVSVTFAGMSEGVSNTESRFDALLRKLMNPPPEMLTAFRRLKW